MLYTIVDLETATRFPVNGQVLSAGVMRVDEFLNIKDARTYYFYKDDYKIDKEALAVNKLSVDFLKSKSGEFDNNIMSLYTYLYNSPIIGKRSDKFDIPYLNNFFLKYFAHMPVFRTNNTLDIERYCGSDFKSSTGTGRVGKLGEYMGLYNITEQEVKDLYNSLANSDNVVAEAHGAMYDVCMTYLALQRYMKKFAVHSLNDLR